MAWRDQLRPASFRGVRFQVLSAGGTFGRRVQVHEYPFRDLPYVEDLGRRARTMRIEAVVIGDDYMARRDALIEAVEKAGPGPLVHPYYGELIVSVDDGGAQFDESTREGGCARIVFSVVESGQARFPSTDVATQDVVELRADVAEAAAGGHLGETLDVGGLPAYAFDAAYDLVDGALNAVERIVSVLPGASLGRGEVLALVGALRPELAAQLTMPLSLALRVQSVLGALRRATDPATAARVMAPLASYDSGSDHLPASTPVRRREQANHDAIVGFVRAAAVTERARASAQIDYPDFNTAVAVRDSVVDQIDQVADVSASEEVYQAMTSLRAAVVRDIGARGANLARIAQVELQQSTPALVLAYKLYEDPTRDAEIVARNDIRHPGFLPAGESLEVLGDA